MPVETTTSRAQYDTNGTSGPWTIPFYFFASTDLLVYYTDSAGNAVELADSVDFTATGAGVESGGALTTTVAYAAGGSLTILQNIEALQPTRFLENNRFPAEAINRGFDRLTLIAQRQDEKLLRSLSVPQNETIDTLPALPDRLGKQLLFHPTTGQPMLSAPVSGTAADVLVSLASSSSAANGAALIGFDPATAYAEGDTAASAMLRQGVTPKMFGAVGDGVADDTTAVNAWAASSFPHFGDPGATYYITGAVTLPNDIIGRGCKFSCSAAASLTTTGALTALPALSASPAAGDQALPFATAHGLTDGDVIVIYNPNDYSFSTARAEFRAGEFCQVYSTAATTVDLIEPLYAGYTAAAVNMYKLTRKEVAWQDFTVSGPDAVVPALKISLATSVSLSNVRVTWANYMGVYLDRCYGISITGGGAFVPKSSIVDCFCLFFGNSQNATVTGGHWYSLRSGTDCGGDDLVGAVPNRNIRFVGSRISNKPTSTGPAANLHGNTEHVLFSGCKIKGAASFEGSEITYDACHISGAALGANALMVGGSEVLGGTYTVRNCTLVGGPAYSTALVRIFNSVNGVRDVHLVLENNTVTMGACQTFARNDMGLDTHKANVTIDGVTFADGAPSMTSVLRMVGTGAAGDGDFVIVDNIHNGPSGALLYFAASGYGAAVRCRLMEQSGTVTITPVSAAAIAASVATFFYSYGSKVPVVSHSLGSGVVNSKTIVPYINTLSSGAWVTLGMRTADSANFGVTTPDITVYWRASVAEI